MTQLSICLSVWMCVCLWAPGSCCSPYQQSPLCSWSTALSVCVCVRVCLSVHVSAWSLVIPGSCRSPYQSESFVFLVNSSVCVCVSVCVSAWSLVIPGSCRSPYQQSPLCSWWTAPCEWTSSGSPCTWMDSEYHLSSLEVPLGFSPSSRWTSVTDTWMEWHQSPWTCANCHLEASALHQRWHWTAKTETCTTAPYHNLTMFPQLDLEGTRESAYLRQVTFYKIVIWTLYFLVFDFNF